MLCISSIFLDGLIEILIGSHARLLVVYLSILEVHILPSTYAGNR